MMFTRWRWRPCNTSARGVPEGRLSESGSARSCFATLPDGQVVLLRLWGLEKEAIPTNPTNVVVGSISDLNRPDAIVLDETAFRLWWPGEPLQTGKTLEISSRRARGGRRLEWPLPGCRQAPTGWSSIGPLPELSPSGTDRGLLDPVPGRTGAIARGGVPKDRTADRPEPFARRSVRRDGHGLLAEENAFRVGGGGGGQLLNCSRLLTGAAGFGVACLSLSMLLRRAGGGIDRRLGPTLIQALTVGVVGVLLAQPAVWGITQALSPPSAGSKRLTHLWISGAAEAVLLNLLAGVAAWAITRFSSRRTAPEQGQTGPENDHRAEQG